MKPAFSSDRLRVFFAYKHSEAEPYRSALDRVYVQLKNHGFEVYRDEESIEISQAWRLALSKAISEADVGLVNWTPAASQSVEVIAEADELRQQDKYCGVFHSELPPIPIFKAIQSVSLEDWRGDLNDHRWRKLINHLERIAMLRKRGPHHKTLIAGADISNPDGLNIQEDPKFPVLRRAKVPATFAMGQSMPGESDGGWNWGVANVALERPFGISKLPVSNREWNAAIFSGADLPPASSTNAPPDAPVTGVSYSQAQAYIAWLNFELASIYYRLPSEAEWEYARRTNIVEDRSPRVREWVADAFSATHAGAAHDGRPRRDPRSRNRTVRGVSFRNEDAEAQVLFRTGYARDFKSNDLGFRVVREL